MCLLRQHLVAFLMNSSGLKDRSTHQAMLSPTEQFRGTARQYRSSKSSPVPQTTTVTTPTSDGFSTAVAKVSHAYAVQVTYGASSENQKLVTIDSNDSRFNEIMKYLSNSTVKRVTQKYVITTEGNVTTTTSVTVLYPH